jgi:hypothetical protein
MKVEREINQGFLLCNDSIEKEEGKKGSPCAGAEWPSDE